MLVENKIEIGGYVPNQLEEIGTFLNMGFATPTTMFVLFSMSLPRIANCSSSPWLSSLSFWSFKIRSRLSIRRVWLPLV